jgi:hypothetical protein
VNLFGPFLSKKIDFIDLDFGVGLLSDEVNFVKTVVILAFDFCWPWRVLFSVNEDKSAFFEVVHYGG